MPRRPITSPPLTAQVRIPDTVLFRALDDELVLLNLSTGFYFSLDAVGASIWHAIQQDGRLAHVLTQLVSEFAVEEGRAQDDLTDLVVTLCEHDLLELVPATE